ncbi:hypothetical protein B0T26DRAFT_741076 [Lasiosphaeria miniovina]|uniref:Uncharacterized protein n=1 Tax=Lasiosphaeria miniovina TaxID=1954250 RepID=A0AA40DYS9_9PEZI|nr:uncharacterized protein B0T26DRAFT_741076 [Lasiosphaeria miniovina]KAK0717921.1 hypothetical protein B0T26DRAFT_741076 [Lasiosphaeria miniovina]
MPRQLPWLVKGKGNQAAAPPKQPASSASASASSASHSPAPPPANRPTPQTTKSEEHDPSSDARTKSRRSLGLRSFAPVRSPSTSPPPEPVKEEFMIDGVDSDDRYRMVEDEFFAVAGDFTRHLHAAEYKRLKTLANSENAEAIQNISRPVTGDMRDLVKRRRAALENAAKQHQAIPKAPGKRASGDGSESDDEESSSPWAHTSLRGLMDSPRKKAVPLAILGSVVAGSRAAVSSRERLNASPSRQLARRSDAESRMKTENTDDEDDDDDDDDDDLDNQAPWPTRQQPQRLSKSAEISLSRHNTAGKPLVKLESRPHQTPQDEPGSGSSNKSKTVNLPSIKQPKYSQLDPDEDGNFFSGLRTRRAERRRRHEIKTEANVKTSDSQAVDLSEIPSFL